LTTTLALTTDYSVTLNSNQDTSPGGSITLTAGNLAVGTTLTITSGIAALQGLDLANGGAFYPDVINDALDKLTILIQQLQVAVSIALDRITTQPCVPNTMPRFAGIIYTAPGRVAAVFVNGVLQPSSAYTLSEDGTIITFNYTLDVEELVHAICKN
jgi:hypothetical protein